MMSKRAAIYARVSSDEQRNNYSIPTQVQECTAFAMKKGYSIVGDCYIDPETGKDISKGNGSVAAYVDDFTSRELSRPGLDNALSFLENIGFDILVVHSLDRLARDPYIRQTLEIEIDERGASVDYVLGNYEATPEGEVRKDLDATFSKWENLKRVERSQRGKRGKAKRGLFVAGRPPYGYILDENAPAGLAVDQKQAKVVNRIFNLYVKEGESIRGIAEILTREGVETYNGKTKWWKSSIDKILNNETYIGKCYYNKTKRNGRRREERSEEDWIEIPITPIVEIEIFEEAQQGLRHNRAVRRRKPKRFYLLSGIVFCVDCGRPFAAQTQLANRHRRINDAKSYRHRSKEGHCRNQIISARRLEPAVWDKIVGILLDPENLRVGYESCLEQQQASQKRHRRRLEILQRERKKVNQKQSNLMTAYLDPDIQLTKDEFIEQREMIEGEIKNLDQEICSIEDQLSMVEHPPEYETIEIFASEIRDQLQETTKITDKDKRKIMELLHVKVFIAEDGQIWLEGWFDANKHGLSSTSYS